MAVDGYTDVRIVLFSRDTSPVNSFISYKNNH
jgi:hypothetical protein